MHPDPSTPSKNNTGSGGSGGSSGSGGSGGNGGNGGGGAPSPSSPPSSSTPFHSRSVTNRRKKNNNIYYQPSVHQFSCRGAFHLQSKKDDYDENYRSDNEVGNDSSQQQQQENEGDDDLEALIKDTFLCNGIQTKLRHVADYPLARSKDEAIGWFEGSSPVGVTEVRANAKNGGPRDGNNVDARGDKNDGDEKGEVESVAMEPESSFSSYGTTQVNILTVQEVPVIAPDDRAAPPGSSPADDDPFGGFGAVAPSGMLNPFGSLFGGFFGGGGFPAEGGSSSGGDGGGWIKGSRSVTSTSSTRMERDENGKRVVTTVTKTKVVEGGGKRRTETVTTERHVDDGGRVETKKLVQTDGDDDKGPAGGEGNGKDGAAGDGDDRARHPTFPSQVPFLPPVAAAPSARGPASPVEVAVIATDCLLGLSVSDSASADPEGAAPRGGAASDDGGSGWHKTEYLFRLSRFIPPFMIVNRYYQDKEEEERRRKEIQKEFDDMREQHKKSRWDRLVGRRSDELADGKDGGKASTAADATTREAPISNNISAVSAVSTRTEYYLQRIYLQMGKNLSMMGVLGNEMIQPEFPKKVQVGGMKILDNMGPTAERTGRLMADVWQMWTGWDGWSNNGGGGEEEGGRGGDGRRR